MYSVYTTEAISIKLIHQLETRSKGGGQTMGTECAAMMLFNRKNEEKFDETKLEDRLGGKIKMHKGEEEKKFKGKV